MSSLSDAEINEILTFTEELGFWSLNQSYRPEVKSETKGNMFIMTGPTLDFATGTLTLNLADRTHSVDVYPSTLEEMPESYRTLRDRLLNTQPANATTYDASASGFRLEARDLGTLQSMPSRNRAVFVEWPFADVALADVIDALLTLDGSQGEEIRRFSILKFWLINTIRIS